MWSNSGQGNVNRILMEACEKNAFLAGYKEVSMESSSAPHHSCFLPSTRLEEATTVRGVQSPFNKKKGKGIRVEPLNQYQQLPQCGHYPRVVGILQRWQRSLPSSLYSHVTPHLQRWDGVYSVFPLLESGRAFTNRIWWEWHSAQFRTSLKGRLPLLETSYQVRSQNTRLWESSS